MSTRHPRVNVVLERPLLEGLKRLAARDDVSLSLKARDLLREALALEEDARLSLVAAERSATWVRQRAVSHDRAGSARGKARVRRPGREPRGSLLVARLRGRGTVRMTTDQIMRLTRG